MSPRDVVEAVKRLSPAPAALRVELVEGEAKELALPKAGNRWAKLEQLVTSLPPWVRIEALDAQGRVFGGMVNEGEGEDEVEADGGDDEGELVISTGALRLFARLLADSQKTTLREASRMFESQGRATAAALEAMSDGQRMLVDTYRHAMQVQAAAQAAGAGAGGEVGDEMAMMLKLAMMGMMQPKVSGAIPAPQQQRPAVPADKDRK